jgi:endonuclease/exonuclease/phosphatase family metal-dependent hydrolase
MQGGLLMEHSHGITLVTLNVLADFLSADGMPSWEARRPLVAEALRRAQPDLVGLQEAMPAQSAWLRAALPDLTMEPVLAAVRDQQVIQAVQQHYGIDLSGPAAPFEVVLFFRTAAFDRLEGGWWWLSPTPAVPSVGFGNVAPRVLQWLKLRHVASGLDLLVANTHIDWRASLPMLALCCTLLDPLVSGERAAILLGDLNSAPGSAEYRLLLDAGWQDSGAGRDRRAQAARSPRAAHGAGDPGDASDANAHTRRRRSPPDPHAERIDHILYRGTGVTVQEWQRLPSPDPVHRLSDHDPVRVVCGCRAPPSLRLAWRQQAIPGDSSVSGRSRCDDRAQGPSSGALRLFGRILSSSLPWGGTGMYSERTVSVQHDPSPSLHRGGSS